MIRTCAVCGAEFDRPGRWIVCSDACANKRKLEREKKYRQLIVKPVVYANCEICGKEFIKRGQQQYTCGDPKCKEERHRRYRCSYYQAYYAEQRAQRAKRNLPKRVAAYGLTVLHDPDYESAFRKGARFSREEVQMALAHDAFSEGTVLLDTGGSRWQVSYGELVEVEG